MGISNADRSAAPVLDYTRNHSDTEESVHHYTSGGLTKREHIAALALQGILANHVYEPPRRNKLAGMALDAVAAADALITALDHPSQADGLPKDPR